MKIVILDKDTVTVNGEVNFARLEKLGEVHIFANLQEPDKIIRECESATVILLNKVNLTRELINALPTTLKLIVITATGFDNVDIKAALERNIKVVNVPGYGTNAVSQLAIFFILSCAIQFAPQMEHMQNNGWDRMAGLSISMHEVAGKILGIVGLGEIGESVAKLAQAFGMKVIAYNRSPKNINNVEQVNLVELAQRSDFISLNCALTADTAKMINSEFIARMKPSAYLINTARGGLIDEDALADALKNKKIAGAALDVLTEEPPKEDNPLLNLKNVILTPHIGWVPIEARQRCIDIAIQNIENFIDGKPTNLLH